MEHIRENEENPISVCTIAMGIDIGESVRRAKTREEVRDAAWASAHALATVARIVRNREAIDKTEQCSAKMVDIHRSTDSSAMLFGMPARMVVEHPSTDKTVVSTRPYMRRVGGNRGESGRKGFEYRDSQPRMESNSRLWGDHGSTMVDHRSTMGRPCVSLYPYLRLPDHMYIPALSYDSVFP